MIYANPGTPDAIVTFKDIYQNFIDGQWIAPSDGQYFDNISPVNGEVFCKVARSTEADLEKAIHAAQTAFESFGKTSVQERSHLLLKIADRMEQNLEALAVAETWDNGKSVRETLAADMPLAIDHFRYFAGCLRAQEGSISEIDANTVAYHFYEPLGVVGQIIPWNFPILMAAWKLAPALAAGNCVILKPAEQTPASILYLFELIEDILPKGVVNILNGFGMEIGHALATSTKISKIAFTGSTATGGKILHAAADNLIPSTVELGGKSPNIYFNDVFAKDDAFLDKCIEGAVLAYLNQGEVCTCPSRLLVQEDIYDAFIEKFIARTKQIKRGNPLDTETMVGAQASKAQYEKILNYIEIGKEEGAKVLIGGGIEDIDGLNTGYYIQPTLLEGNNKMRVFQEEIFGPVVSVTKFKDMADAIAIANDTDYGLGAGVWTRDMKTAYQVGRAVQAGRVWTNCYHAYPAHAAFGGYKKSGIGRETHKLALSHYQQVKNLLVSYDDNPLGFF